MTAMTDPHPQGHQVGKQLPMLLAALGLVLPLLLYLALPALGISAFAEALGLKKLLLLAGAGLGALAYWQYWKFIIPRPQLLVSFVMLAWPIVAFCNMQLLILGINLHMTPLLMLGIMFPMLWVAGKDYRQVLSNAPWIKFYLAFFAWLALYFVFYNAKATDPRLSGGENALGEGSVSMVQLTSYLYCLLTMSVSAITILKTRNFQGLFDFLNQALLWVTGVEAIITILGFPLQMTSLTLDGFLRAIGIFTHPNPFAHHMGIVMVYLLGLYCYYQGERRHRMPTLLLWSGLGLNGIAFLLGLSKTAFSAFAFCALLLFLLNLAVPAVRRGFINILFSLIVLVPVGLVAFEILSGQSFFTLMESRINETQSLNWRTMIWQDLLAEVDLASIWLGHGFTAANQTVFHLTFNDAKNANPLMMVHNAYIALIYDLGIPGYLMFAAAVALIAQSVRGWIEAVRPALRTEHSIIIALTCYFLFVCGFDEMSYMFDAPQLYWTLVSLLFFVSLRERKAEPA